MDLRVDGQLRDRLLLGRDAGLHRRRPRAADSRGAARLAPDPRSRARHFVGARGLPLAGVRPAVYQRPRSSESRGSSRGRHESTPLPQGDRRHARPGRRRSRRQSRPVGTFFYRTDLLKESEFPKTWDDFVKTSQRLQKDGKVKWGFAGGMKYPHGWFTFFWSIWANGGDLMMPLHERRNEELAKAGWKAAIDSPEAVQAVEFWWDNIKTHKIAPPGQPGYWRDHANAIFMAGDSAITMADTTLYGKFNDPKQSKVAGKISVASFPMGPRAKFKSIAWRDAWAWAIPIHVDSAQKKAAKDLLNWINLNKEAQVDLWKATGGFPPNEDVQKELIKTDAVFRKFRAATVESEKIIHGAYYFARWPEFFATGIDHLVQAVTGPRDGIKATLAEGSKKMSEIAARA